MQVLQKVSSIRIMIRKRKQHCISAKCIFAEKLLKGVNFALKGEFY